MTAHYGITHGLAIGILLPHVIRFNAQTVPELYCDLIEESGLQNGHIESAAEVLAERILSLMHLAKLPTKLSACGVSRGILPLLSEEAAQQWTARFNPRPVTEREILSLFESAL